MDLSERYRAVRARTVALCAPLSVEDQQVQPMADASPAKWHLAHTTWFFETFVLAVRPGLAIDAPFDPAFGVLFNSYYQGVGPSFERARRGTLTRPSLDRVHAYRAEIDRRIGHALAEGALDGDARARIELGLHHEQQHQELVLSDVKYLLGTQPLRPAYRDDLRRTAEAAPSSPAALAWRAVGGGVVTIGAGPEGFAYDNERPRHEAMAGSFALAARPLANADVLDFIAAGGYREPRLWLSDGWDAVRSEGWKAPLYWLDEGDVYTLGGVRSIERAATACHLSYFEADAIARWMGARLPTEVEWESAARGLAADATDADFADDDRLHPGPAGALSQMFGTVWEWTSSSYSPYPGFQPLPGALGEYNGKFMSGQQVLRGGSCFTPRGHVRATYRNYFPPGARWQMSGVRLARDA